MLAPVTKRVEMVRGMITIVVAEPIALFIVSIHLLVKYVRSNLQQRRSV